MSSVQRSQIETLCFRVSHVRLERFREYLAQHRMNVSQALRLMLDAELNRAESDPDEQLRIAAWREGMIEGEKAFFTAFDEAVNKLKKDK